MVEADRIASEATAEAAAATAQLDPGDVFAEAEGTGGLGNGGAKEDGSSGGCTAGERGPHVMLDEEGVVDELDEHDVYDDAAGFYDDEPSTLEEEPVDFLD